jgi:PrgI family protein
MEYQVPQFIEVESKIVGPLTLKQFIYVAGGAGLCILFFVYLQIILALILSLAVAALAGALAFYKVNGKSFADVLEAGFNYYTGAKLFLWKHQEPKEQKKSSGTEMTRPTTTSAPDNRKLTRGKLSELAWSLDVQNPRSERENEK